MIGSFLPVRKLSLAEIILLPEAILFLFIYRLKVSYQPSIKWMPKPAPDNYQKVANEEIGNALLIAKIINGLENRTPWKNTCLVKVLATREMLQRRCLPNTIHIGVAPTACSKLKAHAWLSIGTNNIMGGGNLEEFFEISAFQ